MPGLEFTLRQSDLLLIGHMAAGQASLSIASFCDGQPRVILDCARTSPALEQLPGSEGLCW